MNRRTFILYAFSVAALIALLPKAWAKNGKKRSMIEQINKSDEEWRNILTSEQFDVLRHSGTERPFSSPLDKEYGKGVYICAGCDLDLFTSDMKFDSGTGWPSFYTSIKGHVDTEVDYKLIFPRTEYHCARCGGHQGHVFNDGPKPTRQRWCNNGVALQFIPEVGERF